MRVLFVAWQDPIDRRWYPVGRLDLHGGDYRFRYTRGALESKRFMPFAPMTHLRDIYRSSELFPLFANRMMANKRPEYRSFLEWLDLRDAEADPIALLARSGGLRETDSLIMFPCPEPDQHGGLVLHFFCQGIRHLGEAAVSRIAGLKPGDKLFLMPDPQNPHDECAVALRTDDPKTIVGYCPRFLARDFLDLLSATKGADLPQIHVVRVNHDAPIQLRLLCRLTSQWPVGFKPCAGSLYKPLAEEVESIPQHV